MTTVAVTADNFARAETDMYFGMLVKRGGGVGHFDHLRQLHSIEGPGVRPNRDTLYSEAVFDLDAGPVEITLPDPGDRFLSLMVIDQDHYVVMVVYGGGRHTLTREQVGTRYVFAAVRILVDPDAPGDVEQVHALQDALTANQPGSGGFEAPNWDQASQKQVRDALLSLSSTLPDLRKGGGSREEVDPVRHLIATAAGWGLNPDKDAVYLNVTPTGNDGHGVYRLTVTEVPVDGFWSVSVYDAEGHFVKNDRDAYTLNSVTANRDPDGSVTVQFGGCEDQGANCLPIFAGWNYMVRLYRPQPEVLDGTWTFPEAEPVA
jgi:hypothetical protein